MFAWKCSSKNGNCAPQNVKNYRHEDKEGRRQLRYSAVYQTDNKLKPFTGEIRRVLIEKSRSGVLTSAELIMLKNMDLAELRRYEQVSELTVTLLEKWLVTYKFKNWSKHSNGERVTDKEKSERAKNIARELGDNKKWKAHGRPIDINALRGLKLMVTELEKQDSRDDIRELHKLYRDYARLRNPSFPAIFTVLQ